MELTATVCRTDELTAEASAPGTPATHGIQRLLPRRFLPRPRLVERISTPAPVTLVVGPAGTGKTVAVADWATGTSEAVAWVSVMTGTGGRTRFWHTVAEALGVADAVATGTRLGDGPPPLGDLVLGIAAHLESSLDNDTALVIDNYHVGEDDDLAASMGLWLRNLPRRLRVIIVSRHLPRIPIDRLRVAGDLRELDGGDLRFTSSEAHRLVDLLVPDIPDRAADTIIAASDGWAAGLQLCTLAWCDLRPERPTISHLTRHLDEFVMREVLTDESSDLVEFVGDIAAVARTSIALAEAITKRHDAGALLELAEQRGLFVSRAGPRGHYEIHSAVRRAVVADRGLRDPERTRLCHERAARWLEASGETVHALEQWLQAGDPENALRLLAERHVQLYDVGEEGTVSELLAKLPPETTARDVGSLIDLAWCQVLTDVAAFRQNLDDAGWWSEHGGHVDPHDTRRLRALQAIASLSCGEWRRTERLARDALDGYSAWADDPIVRTSWNDVARSIALDERWQESSDEVREITVVLRRDRTRTIALESTRALGLALAGCPVDALRVAGGVRTSATVAHMTMSAGELALTEVVAHRELGDASDAAAELEQLINAEVGPLTYLHGLAANELVQHHLDRGSLTDATRAFCQLERIVADEIAGSAGRSWLGRAGTVLSAEAGDLDRAREWSEMVDDPFWGPVSRARALTAIDRDRVPHHLDDAVPRSPRHTVVLAMLRAATTTDRDAAAAWTESAVQVASANNMLQTLASAGQLELIERIAWRLPADWMDRLRRATANVQPEVHADVSLIEPLTIRERDVLRFLPSRLTLKEIAAELYVSVNTLKFHLKVIYRKLGVTSRAEAAEIARSWGRIDQR